MNEFEKNLTESLLKEMKILKKQGTVGMGFNNLLQFASLLPYKYGFTNAKGNPCGTNSQWMFSQSLKKVVMNNKKIKEYVTDLSCIF